ncbi:MAG: N-formylglutamate deformylase [Pseudacidovorax sp.]|nr:N-formylglutamate deformylase [Pseudacidovorax sp.]
MSSSVYRLQQGTLPLLISIPHLGTGIPEDVRSQLGPVAQELRDTDWHLDRLYGFAAEMGASMLGAQLSRYVIDLNRPPGGESLYPGQTTTGLCPRETFRGEPLYPSGGEPHEAEVQRRLQHYWRPYHAALRAELDRLLALHGQVLLWEAHSIASVLPRLFEGELPALNFGTNDGRSCADDILQAVVDAAGQGPDAVSRAVNGRFKGGYITRQFGAPDSGVHAIQLEMCQHLYMDEEPPFDWRPAQAATIQPVLARMLEAGLAGLRARQQSRGR